MIKCVAQPLSNNHFFHHGKLFIDICAEIETRFTTARVVN